MPKEIFLVKTGNYSITVLSGTEEREQKRHSHRSLLTGYLPSGGRTIRFGGREEAARPGDCFVISPGEIHSLECDEHPFIVLSIPVDCLCRFARRLNGEMREKPVFQSGIFQDQKLSRDIIALSHLESSQSKMEKAAESLFLSLMLNHLSEKSDFLVLVESAVKKTCMEINDHLAEKLTLSRLSRAAGVSEYHLSRMFKARMGLPPHLYILQERVRRSRSEIENGKSLAEAAQNSGFFDQAHFTRAFHRFVGVTPEKYAKVFHLN